MLGVDRVYVRISFILLFFVCVISFYIYLFFMGIVYVGVFFSF